jgi:hypothetical protein
MALWKFLSAERFTGIGHSTQTMVHLIFNPLFNKSAEVLPASIALGSISKRQDFPVRTSTYVLADPQAPE